MNKPLFGLLLGGILGIFDGLSALFSAPETAPGIVGIVIGSTIKGLIAGVLIGYFARKVNSLLLGILFGLLVGAFLAFWVAFLQGKYYLEIMLPGSLVGVIVGYATQKHSEARKSVAAALLLPLLLVLAPAVQAGEPAAGLDAKAAFDVLKSLAGTWEGTAGGGDHQIPFKSIFRVTAAGSVVEETMFAGTDHEMINMYHVNGDELRITHYCAAGNQPEMTLDRSASKPDELVFTFAGGTGFDPAKDMHIHGGRITLKGDAMDVAWSAWAGGKDAGTNRGTLKRAGGKAEK